MRVLSANIYVNANKFYAAGCVVEPMPVCTIKALTRKKLSLSMHQARVNKVIDYLKNPVLELQQEQGKLHIFLFYLCLDVSIFILYV